MDAEDEGATYQAGPRITCRPRCVSSQSDYDACVCERASYEKGLLEAHERFWKFDADRVRWDEPVQPVTCYATPPDKADAAANGLVGSK